MLFTNVLERGEISHNSSHYRGLSTVYVATYKILNIMVALKKFHIDRNMNSLEHEFQLQQKCSSNYIAECYTMIRDGVDLYVRLSAGIQSRW